MLQIHYQSFLNSVESTQHKASVKLETTNILKLVKFHLPQLTSQMPLNL